MKTILFTLIMINMISNMIFKMNKFINFKNFTYPNECGFNNINNFKMNFSINFFIIMIMFMFFDLEIVILIPITNSYNIINTKNMMIMFIMFITATLIMEMKNNMIKWII